MLAQQEIRKTSSTASQPIEKKPQTPAARMILVMAAICTGYFMVILDTTVVNVALVNIHQQLGATSSELQWVVDGYSLVFASLLLTGGCAGYMRHPFTESRFDNNSRAIQRQFFRTDSRCSQYSCVILCRRCHASNCEREYSEKIPHEMAVGGLAKIKAEEERAGLRDEAACLSS